jgi:hypothetical protein
VPPTEPHRRRIPSAGAAALLPRCYRVLLCRSGWTRQWSCAFIERLPGARVAQRASAAGKTVVLKKDFAEWLSSKGQLTSSL